MTMYISFLKAILYILPKNLISWLWGKISLIPIPIFLRFSLYRTFFYKIININENEFKGTYRDYRTLNAFFTRAMKDGERPIDMSQNIIISPVDGVVSELGIIKNGRLMQVKNMEYLLEELYPDYHTLFYDGNYITIYLAPHNYHRIHSPFSGRILSVDYYPGTLFPVNKIGVNGVKKLFVRNERLITLLDTGITKIGIVKVGAMLVGKIRLTFDSIETNNFFTKESHIRYNNNNILNDKFVKSTKEFQFFNRIIKIKKGEEFSRFDFGSTIILLFEKDKSQLSINNGSIVKMGEKIGKLI